MNQAVQDLLVKTLEKSAFLFLEPCQTEDLLDLPEKSMLLELVLQGENPGKLTLLLPDTVAREVAGNMLGVEPEVCTWRSGVDAAKELLNQVSGSFLTLMAPDDATAEPGLPQAAICDASTWHRLADLDNAQMFFAENQPVLFHYEMEKELFYADEPPHR